MAEAFRRVRGGPHNNERVEHALAYHRKSQWGVRNEAYKGAQRARIVLDVNSEERTGTSSIVVEKNGSTNWSVWLTDTRGQGAANIIEFGRSGDSPRKPSPSRAVAPLGWAFGFGNTGRGQPR